MIVILNEETQVVTKCIGGKLDEWVAPRSLATGVEASKLCWGRMIIIASCN